MIRHFMLVLLLIVGSIGINAQEGLDTCSMDSVAQMQLVNEFAESQDTLVMEMPALTVNRCNGVDSVCVEHRFKVKSLIVPATFVAIGAFGVSNQWIRSENRAVRDELQKHVKRKYEIDSYIQYAPMVAVYGLNLCGVKGRHNFLDRTIILATSSAIMATVVNVVKHTVNEERPDHSAFNSFPSGHTATAFMGAEFLRKEYAHVSPWIGVAGYTVATMTGFFRMYNNRHWLTDIVAGAGVGILSAKAAYWLYPPIKRLFSGKKSKNMVMAAPFVSGEGRGMSLVVEL